MINQLFSLLCAKRTCFILETGYFEKLSNSTASCFSKGIIHFSLLHFDFAISSWAEANKADQHAVRHSHEWLTWWLFWQGKTRQDRTQWDSIMENMIWLDGIAFKHPHYDADKTIKRKAFRNFGMMLSIHPNFTFIIWSLTDRSGLGKWQDQQSAKCIGGNVHIHTQTPTHRCMAYTCLLRLLWDYSNHICQVLGNFSKAVNLIVGSKRSVGMCERSAIKDMQCYQAAWKGATERER